MSIYNDGNVCVADYDAPISEAGEITQKVIELRKVIMAMAQDSLSESLPHSALPCPL